MDLKVIERLMLQARSSWADLGELLGLSAPAAADRVRRLEEQGVIKRYSAQIDPEAIGCTVTAFIAVTLDRPETRELFLQLVEDLTQIQECHHVAGEDDYLLKVRCGRLADLEQLVSEELKRLPGVVRTRTTIVLSTVKETTVLPIVEQVDTLSAGGRKRRG